MAQDKLERTRARLEGMQARNIELRDQIAARSAEREKIVARHTEAERQLTDQLTRLRAASAAEVTAHDNESTALAKRRAELKEDYGDLKPMFDQLEAATEQPAAE